MQLTDPVPTPERSGERAVLARDSDGVPRKSLALGLVIAEKYRLERILRRGGMGSVWVATHLGLQSPVAIKFMASRLSPDDPSAGDESARARFEREASAAARLRMANIVQVLDYGVDNGIPYIVMELLEGEDLGARLDRVKRMSIADAAKVLTAVARALQRAHDMGLVHRDLKPENIFLAREGDDEVPKILDFGVAKAIQGGDQHADSSTSEGTVVGTPFYISPEQAVGRTDIDHRSDLWSLGVIAYRMLTGQRPFQSDLLLEVVVEICSAPIPKPTSIAPDLPPAVDTFIDRALAREPEQRFASARELAAAFAELGEVGAARGGRRPWLWIAVIAAVVIALSALAAWWAGRPSSGPALDPPSATPPAGTFAGSPPSAVPSSAPSAAVTATPSARPTSEVVPQPTKGQTTPKGTSRPWPKPTATRNVGY
jgi:serine/threonine protein kinase